MGENLVFLCEMVIEFKNRSNVATSRHVISITGDSWTVHGPEIEDGTMDGDRRMSNRGGDLPVTIIGCAPHGHDRAVKHELVALHRELMRARDEVDRVIVRKRLGDVRSKEKAGAPRR